MCGVWKYSRSRRDPPGSQVGQRLVTTAVVVKVSGPPPPNFTPMSTNLPPVKPSTGPEDGGQGQGQPSLPQQLPPGQFR